MKQHQGQLPLNFDELVQLPGIGASTAGAISLTQPRTKISHLGYQCQASINSLFCSPRGAWRPAN